MTNEVIHHNSLKQYLTTLHLHMATEGTVDQHLAMIKIIPFIVLKFFCI